MMFLFYKMKLCAACNGCRRGWEVGASEDPAQIFDGQTTRFAEDTNPGKTKIQSHDRYFLVLCWCHFVSVQKSPGGKMMIHSIHSIAFSFSFFIQHSAFIFPSLCSSSHPSLYYYSIASTVATVLQ